MQHPPSLFRLLQALAPWLPPATLRALIDDLAELADCDGL
jgi:hypothetical protein